MFSPILEKRADPDDFVILVEKIDCYNRWRTSFRKNEVIDSLSNLIAVTVSHGLVASWKVINKHLVTDQRCTSPFSVRVVLTLSNYTVYELFDTTRRR